MFLVDGQQVGQIRDPGMFPDNRAILGANVPSNTTLAIHNILIEAAQGQTDVVQVVPPADTGVYVPAALSLRELADARGIRIGAAVEPGPLRCDPSYAAALSHEFNALTAENAMKFGPIHPEPERYDFRDADAIVDFAESHDMLVRGHTLVWHNQLPGWIQKRAWSREALEKALHDHITTVVGRYRGRIVTWDVVNEAIDENGLRDTVWLRVIGPEYIALAFKWAHEADPDALLFYNDYASEELGLKSDVMHALLEDLLRQGVPIHGVGLQTHSSVTAAPNPASVRENMDRFAALGLQVQITEMDVRIRGEPTARTLGYQATIYREMLETCLAAQDCTALVLWGFTDRHSWIPSHAPGWGSALILDEQYQTKPAYDAIREALKR